MTCMEMLHHFGKVHEFVAGDSDDRDGLAHMYNIDDPTGQIYE